MHPWTYSNIFLEWRQHPNFAYPLQVADDAVQMDVHKSLYPFYPISLCWLNFNSQSFVCNVFCTSAIRNAILFMDCLISIFEQFLQTSHNLRIIKGQNHMSDEKTPLQNCFQAMRSRTDKTIGQLIEVRTPRRLKKNWADELRKIAAANITSHLVLTKKSKPCFKDKDVFPQVCIDAF